MTGCVLCALFKLVNSTALETLGPYRLPCDNIRTGLRLIITTQLLDVGTDLLHILVSETCPDEFTRNVQRKPHLMQRFLALTVIKLMTYIRLWDCNLKDMVSHSPDMILKCR